MYEHSRDAFGANAGLKEYDLAVHKWMRKHGIDNISATVLERLSGPDELDAAEVKWIAKYNTFLDHDGLNLRPGGDTNRGWHHNAKARAAIGISSQNRPGGNRSLDHRHVPEVRRRILAGETYRSIAEVFGVRSAVVSQIAMGTSYAKVNDDGVFDASLPGKRPSIQNGHKFQRKLQDADKADILARIGAGEARKDIGARYGVSEATVCRLVKRAGLSKRVKLSSAQEDQIKMLYAVDGRTVVSLSAQFGAERHALARMLKDAA